MAVANYEDTHGHFPPAYLLGPDGKPWHSWRVLLLPFIEGQHTYDRYRFDEPWDGPHNRELAGAMPKMFALHGPHPPGYVTTNYLAVVGPDTMWPGAVGRPAAEITSDRSGTILIVENNGLGVHWMEPRDLDVGTMSYEFNHPHGLSSWHTFPGAVMADGGLRSFSNGYRPDTLRAMLSATRGDRVPLDPAVRPMPDGRLRDAKGG